MPKSPYFQFYPGDWLRNDVSGCSLEAQGLWLRMMMIMHDAQVYGRLVLENKPMLDTLVARKSGISLRKYRSLLRELEDFGVVNRDENGVIFSGRMERDERERQQNRERQLNHYKKTHIKPNGNLTEQPNGNLTPDLTAIQQLTRARLHSSSLVRKEEEKKELSEADSPKEKTRTPRAAADPKTMLPITYQPTLEMLEWARAECPSLKPQAETEEFVTFWRDIATKNNRRTPRGWHATWKNRMKERQERIGANNGSHQKPSSEREKSAQRDANSRRFADELERQARSDIAAEALLLEGPADSG